jgi:hypothetical protein
MQNDLKMTGLSITVLDLCKIKDRHFIVLCCRYLQYSVDETKVRIQDTVSVIAYVSRNPLGRRLAWDFVRSQWDTLFTKYGTGSFGFGRLVRYITAYFNTRFEVEEVSLVICLCH